MPLSQQTKLGLVVFAAVGGVFLVIVVGVVGLVVLGRGNDPTPTSDGKSATGGPSVGIFGPSAGRESERWTVRDLVAYLEQKGAVKPDQVLYATPLGTPVVELVVGEDVVMNIVHCDSPQKARDLAAGRGKEAYFGWGRFAISGKRATVEAARRALGAD